MAIGTLRLRTAAADSPALRLRAARELQGAELTPRGLAPAAVLVLRRLADPLPGRFGGGRIRPRPEWEAAVRDALTAAARTAARPDAHGRISAAADAVLFSDETELIACLLVDAARGEVTARWWWKAVLPRLGRSSALATSDSRNPAPLLNTHAREAPAVLTLLSQWGEAATVASRLSPAGTTPILVSLAREHALSADLVSPPARVAMTRADEGISARRSFGEAGRSLHLGQDPDLPRAPWSEWLPPGLDDERFAPEIQCLFGIARALHVAPARLRSPLAAAQARRWWQALTHRRTGTSRTPDPVDRNTLASSPSAVLAATGERGSACDPLSAGDAAGRTVEHGSQLLRAERKAPGDVPAVQVLSDDCVHASASAAIPYPSAAGTAGDDARSVARVRPFSLVVPDRAPSDHGDAREMADGLTGATAAVRVQSPADVAPSAAPADVPEHRRPPAVFAAEGLATRLGGILYLMHALEALGLPGAFESSWRLATSAGPWGTLDLIARALLGRRFALVADDPMWAVLADLAGWRQHQRGNAGNRIVVPADSEKDPAYRVPALWRTHLMEPCSRFVWTALGNRLWIWSAAGYLIAHRRCRRPDPVAVRRECARFVPRRVGAIEIVRRDASAIPWMPLLACPAGCPQRSGRWAASAAPAVHRRLLLALGGEVSADPASGDSVADLLAIPGRVHVTSSHVDLVMSIDQANPVLRRAGLDRDPGWLPEYGRVVSFHFQ